MAGSPRVLIPGGTGYLGGRIAEHLAERGLDVCVCSRSKRIWSGPSSNLAVQAVDWREPSSLDAAANGADAIVMLAAANEIDAAQDPVAAADATATQCLAWLQAARRQGVRRFLYFSTIHVYGTTDGALVDEQRLPKPLHPYASTHLAAEIFVQTAHRHGATAASIFRLSNAFGPPVDPAVNRWTLLVNDLARQAVLDGELNLKTDGLQSRDFVGISTVCRAVEWWLAQKTTTCEAAIYNLGSGQSTTVYAMAQRVAARARAVFARDFPINRPPPSPGAVAKPYCLDVSAVSRAGFAPQTDCDREIDTLLAFCQRHVDQMRRA